VPATDPASGADRDRSADARSIDDAGPPKQIDDGATRRTGPPAARGPLSDTTAQRSGPPQAPSMPARRQPRSRLLRTVLLVVALAFVFNEYRIGARASRLAASVPTRELDGLADAWTQYDRLSASSFRIGVIKLERALVRQSATLADRVIGNYRTPAPTVREAQWRMAREALARAAGVAPNDPRIQASLRYCEGHLHRINGEARKARRQTVEAQHEFTDAVTAFREAAELRPNWPDPFLGLGRTFIYGLEDVDRGADALQQAERLGYMPGDRESVQLADGYRARGDTFARTAQGLTGMPQEQEYLNRAAEAYREAISRYAKALAFGDAPRSLRQAQRGLRRVEQRLADLSEPPAEPAAAAPTVAREGPRWP
jgi:tetratricopeptide (TPR) repeat protein